jgi:hypothetical protein
LPLLSPVLPSSSYYLSLTSLSPLCSSFPLRPFVCVKTYADNSVQTLIVVLAMIIRRQIYVWLQHRGLVCHVDTNNISRLFFSLM